MSFQFVIYHPILSNNCNGVFPALFFLYSVTPGVTQRGATMYCIVHTRHNQFKTLTAEQ